jgi:GTP-binding protein EngB required for normal cell division
MRVLVALTKVDKLTNRSRAELTRELEKDELYGPLDKILFSIVTGEGRREILRWMEAQLTYAKTLSKR